MRKRNCRVEIYFTKTELEALTKKVRKAGLSREGYCRRILNGAVVKEAPPAELPLLIREVRRVDRVINYARNPEKTSEGIYEELASLHAID